MPYKDPKKAAAWALNKYRNRTEAQKNLDRERARIHYSLNREHYAEKWKKWSSKLKNIKLRKKYAKEYRAKNIAKICRINISMLRQRRKEKPWLSHYDCARTRCLNKNRNSYKRYMKRGIKFLLTHQDIKNLWFRDNAFKLKMPSIDRIDVDGHYEFSNCRFIERSENCTKGNYEARWK